MWLESFQWRESVLTPYLKFPYNTSEYSAKVCDRALYITQTYRFVLRGETFEVLSAEVCGAYGNHSYL